MKGSAHVAARARAGARVAASPRVRALLLLWRASPGLSVAALGFVVAEGALPVLVLIAMGRVTGAIPGALEFGLGSAAGQRLLIALAAAGIAYSLSLMRGPVEDALTAAATARVDSLMQRQLVEAVCTPVGIEHLEDEQALDRLASARGQLLGSQPAGAPMALISLAGDRLTGILACAVLATFRWWLGLGVLLVWLSVRRPLGSRVRLQAARVRRAGAPIRLPAAPLRSGLPPRHPDPAGSVSVLTQNLPSFPIQSPGSRSGKLSTICMLGFPNRRRGVGFGKLSRS